MTHIFFQPPGLLRGGLPPGDLPGDSRRQRGKAGIPRQGDEGEPQPVGFPRQRSRQRVGEKAPRLDAHARQTPLRRRGEEGFDGRLVPRQGKAGGEQQLPGGEPPGIIRRVGEVDPADAPLAAFASSQNAAAGKGRQSEHLLHSGVVGHVPGKHGFFLLFPGIVTASQKMTKNWSLFADEGARPLRYADSAPHTGKKEEPS